MSSLPTSLYFTNAAGLVQEYADYVRLQYHPGPRRFDEFTAVLHHVTRALTRYGLGKLLIDQRQMTPYLPAERVHVVEHWLPRTIVEGPYRYGAVVQAHDVFARLAMDTIRTQAQDLPLTYRFFSDEVAAIGWLQAQ
ncbi:hypothetical protein [Hymenobacter coccineus]|uniref:STAS/SEC14 domain-containing protein n=1 Tax=Hymenobacter coccineus TaxID=1908235 RepID=A0A1G1SV82_9BACT|nr:hypothetical protein [Hymenobacter coccineus]OGX82514.1 hypothetical protein BEN49_13680 [Hymenobacter coccineus]